MSATDTLTLAEMVRLLSPTDRWRLLGPINRQTFATTERIYLYAIQAGADGPVKIGVAKRPADRIRTLQTANASELCGLAAWRALPGEEKALHEAFVEHHIRGEWFEPATELIEFVLLRGADFCDWDPA